MKINISITPKKLLYGLLCLQCITISFNVAAIAAAIPAISLDLFLSDLIVAKIIPFYMIPYGIGALLYAPLARRISFKAIMAGSMFLFGLSNLLCAVAKTFPLILASRVFMGLAGASAIPLGLVLIGRIFPKEIRGRLVGGFFSCSFFASISGVFLSGIAHWRWLFYIPSALAFIVSGCLLFFHSDYLKPMGGRPVDYSIIFRKKPVRNIFIYIFIISLFYHAVQKWFGVYLYQVYLLDQFTISFYFILMAIGGAFGQIVGGFLTDKKGRFFTCYMGIIVLSVSTMLLFRIYPLAVLAIILLMLSAGWTVGHNGISTVLTDFPDENRPEVASLNSSVRFISGGIGFFISRMFVAKSFGLTFLCCGVALFFLSFLLKRILPQKSF